MNRRQIILLLTGTLGTEFAFDKRKPPPEPGLLMKAKGLPVYLEKIKGCVPGESRGQWVSQKNIKHAARMPTGTHAASLACAKSLIKDVTGLEIEWIQDGGH